VGQRRHIREQWRLDVLARDQKLNGLDPCSRGSGDEILAFGDEEPELVTPAAVLQLADELQLLVLAGGDQDC
jgi:hypothetical protein